jgi:hypothetical protein
MGRPHRGLAGRVGRGARRGRYRPFGDVSQVRDEALLPHHDAVQGELDASQGCGAGVTAGRGLALMAAAVAGRGGTLRYTRARDLPVRPASRGGAGGYPTVSVVRGDDRMLVTPYLRFFIGSNSPTFEFRADQAPKMFIRYARHFENTWNLAEDWT